MTSLLSLLAMEAPLFALLYAGYRQQNGAALFNTIVAILATATPGAVELALRAHSAPQASFTSLLTLWVGVASVLHCLGMLGLYESLEWWDHLTHTISAALTAALLYAALLVAVGPASGGGTAHLAVATLGLVLVLSLLWELTELVMRGLGKRYGIEPVLVHYGWQDTEFDLVFDIVGAVLVLALDVRLFVPVFETLHPVL
jgi:hypothetical protein